MVGQTDVLPLEGCREKRHLEPIGEQVDPAPVLVPVKDEVVGDWVSDAEAPSVSLVCVSRPTGLKPLPQPVVNVLKTVLHVILDYLVRGAFFEVRSGVEVSPEYDGVGRRFLENLLHQLLNLFDPVVDVVIAVSGGRLGHSVSYVHIQLDVCQVSGVLQANPSNPL